MLSSQGMDLRTFFNDEPEPLHNTSPDEADECQQEMRREFVEFLWCGFTPRHAVTSSSTHTISLEISCWQRASTTWKMGIHSIAKTHIRSFMHFEICALIWSCVQNNRYFFIYLFFCFICKIDLNIPFFSPETIGEAEQHILLTQIIGFISLLFHFNKLLNTNTH